MQGALIILLFTVVVGILLYLWELRYRKNHPEVKNDPESETVTNAQPAENNEATDPSNQECCGLHLVCEKDSLSPMSDDVIYYDDEELDRFIGREADSYTPDEEEEFRNVLMTLRPEDVAGWARSVTQRRLNLPDDVRDELLMLVNEQRTIQPKSDR
jgi:hypothetical protein